MPSTIIKKAKFDPKGGSLTVALEFMTLLLCTYSLDLRERQSNMSIEGFPKRGDNSNPEDDKYELPGTPSANTDRSIWAFMTVINQTGEKATYEVVMSILQDGKVLERIATGKKELAKNNETEIFAVKLVS